MSTFANCTQVTPQCPVEATTYGYFPNLGVNAVLMAVFATVCAAQIIACFVTKVYSYSITIALGALMEVIGYSGRISMHSNPWDQGGFERQIVCLIIAPTFIAAGIYLTLKHVVRSNGPEYSRLKPHLYTWVFVGCDIGSIAMQGIGGGLASTGSSHPELLNTGDDIMIAGIAFQVGTMVICGLLAAEYTWNRHKSRRAAKSTETTAQSIYTNGIVFQCAVVFAYLTVLIRCIYRLPEMAGGWGNPLMRKEAEFLALDGLMIALACIALMIFHPGYFYPIMRTTRKGEGKPLNRDSDSILLQQA